MAETPESGAEQTSTRDRGGRLGQALTWVGIIAGVVFVVAVIFFSGFFLGWSSADRGTRPAGPMGSGGMSGTCPMMGSGGMMGPGHQGPSTTESPSPAQTTPPTVPPTAPPTTPPTPPGGPHRHG